MSFLYVRWSRRQRDERVAEEVRILAVVESERDLVQVCGQVLDRQLVVRPDDRPLQQAPYAFYGVGVNIAANPFLGVVVDRLWLMTPDGAVGGQVVGVNVGFGGDVVADEVAEALAVAAADDRKRTSPSRCAAPATMVLLPVNPRPWPVVSPPTHVSSTSTVPSSSSGSGSFIAARMRWVRNHAVLVVILSMRESWCPLTPFLDSPMM